jgi:hypothetical protein
MSRLANAAHHDPARTGQDHLACVDKGRADTLRQSVDRLGFDAQHFDRTQDEAIGAGYNGS